MTGRRQWSGARQAARPSTAESWGAAYEHLTASVDPAPEDLERLAIAANPTGQDDECLEAWERAHHAHIQRGDHDAASSPAEGASAGGVTGGR